MTEGKNASKKNDALEAISSAWGPLTNEQTAALSQHVTLKKYRKNELIYRELEKPSSMMFILEGKAKIYKDGIGTRPRQILRIVKSGEFFAFRAFFAHERYKTSSIAFEPATIAHIDLPFAEKLASENTHVDMYILRHLALILGRSDERIVNLTQKHIRARLAESLLRLQEEYGQEENGGKVCLCLSREDLACFSNMTTSNAIRTLSAFSSEGLVSISGRKVTILDTDALQNISQQG